MKRLIILAITLTIGLSACNALDTVPKDKTTLEDYFKTEAQLQLFTNPLYNNLLDKSPYDAQSDIYVCQTLSDEMIGGTKRTVPNSGGGWSWTDLRRMNELLAYIHNCDDAEAVSKYTALTKFFRAYFYFEKVKRFGDVPWYDQPIGSADPALFNPRDSREFIMTKMISDIDSAIKYLPPAVSTFRANKWAALALKSQFCLYEGTFRKYHGITLEGHDANYYLQEAAKAAKMLIDEGPYKLYKTGNPTKDYLNLFVQEDANKDEYILSIKFDYALAIHHNATGHTLVPTQGRPGLTRKMVNTYLMADGTAFTNRTDNWNTMPFVDEVKDRDPRLAQSIRTPGYTRIGTTAVLAPDFMVTTTGYQPVKFVQDPKDSGGQVDRSDRSTCDLPVYRFAEVLLNYAEAKAELGVLTQDDLNISVNKLRERVGMPNLNINVSEDRYLSEEVYTNVTGAQKSLILEIRRERTIELIQEGFRFDDLVRWKAGYCIDQPIVGTYFKGPGSYDFTGDGKPDVILYEEGATKPDAAAGVQVLKIGQDITLSEGNRGYVAFHKNIERTKFWEERDYLYPIPINERSLNKNLKQNPGWSDGLNF